MRPYTAHRAPVLIDQPHTAPQGRPEQGWPIRRCSPEMAVYDPEDDDKRQREALSAAEAYLLVAIYSLSCVIATWALCVIADAVKGWLS
jgi:hypothetical protein